MKQLIGSDFFKEFTNIGDMKSNGKGSIVFIKYDTNLEKDAYISNLFLFSTKEKVIKEQLTFNGKTDLCEWLDEENLILSEIKEPQDKELVDKGIPLTVFYRFNIAEKSYSELFRINKNISKVVVIDDERYLLLSDDSLMEELYLKQTHGNFEQFAEIIKRESSYFIADEVPFWCNGKGYTNGRRGRLFLYQNGEVTQLSEDDINICDVQTYRQESMSLS